MKPISSESEYYLDDYYFDYDSDDTVPPQWTIQTEMNNQPVVVLLVVVLLVVGRVMVVRIGSIFYTRSDLGKLNIKFT